MLAAVVPGAASRDPGVVVMGKADCLHRWLMPWEALAAKKSLHLNGPIKALESSSDAPVMDVMGAVFCWFHQQAIKAGCCAHRQHSRESVNPSTNPVCYGAAPK
ncbi:Hypothetical predicted protein [Podarcis lilfordi]|uniref:Uncharacterized protein n=1 Tax=Podarcis lilfordi TaxID=74358 RepID=A0AA35KTY8_9SAUR|nr:Hypothetical predicted protein [Podarcis lilfordi]